MSKPQKTVSAKLFPTDADPWKNKNGASVFHSEAELEEGLWEIAKQEWHKTPCIISTHTLQV